jgi:hypothetical protein
MSIQLNDEILVQQIEQAAEQERRTPEQIVREAMHLYITRVQRTPSNSFLLSIAGIGKSGQRDVASRAEEILASEIDPQRGWSLNKSEMSSG